MKDLFMLVYFVGAPLLVLWVGYILTVPIKLLVLYPYVETDRPREWRLFTPLWLHAVSFPMVVAAMVHRHGVQMPPQENWVPSALSSGAFELVLYLFHASRREGRRDWNPSYIGAIAFANFTLYGILGFLV